MELYLWLIVLSLGLIWALLKINRISKLLPKKSGERIAIIRKGESNVSFKKEGNYSFFVDESSNVLTEKQLLK